ncbi:MAG TPA: GYF domain-containing protein [Verrucomicrobiae bacterium]|jgi:uncharacterized membrane protein|nr:GYF domain-containing protein [Verrucomicrobiae bacterium]
MSWRYVQEGQSRGPVELAALQGLIVSGALSPDTLVWQPGMDAWQPLKSVPELAASIPVSAPPLTPPPIATPDLATDIEQNKLLAVMAYLGPLLLVPLLAAPHSRFARFHCNQAFVLFACFFVCYGALWVFSFIPFFICLTLPLHFAAWFAVLFLIVIGVINASRGEAKPLPWIGHYRILN